MTQEHKDWILYGIALMTLVTFLQTCGVKSTVQDSELYIKQQADSIYYLQQELLLQTEDKVISEEEMVELIKTTPAWKTLRIEEISDKERISINALEERDK